LTKFCLLAPAAQALQMEFNNVFSGTNPSRDSPLAILTPTDFNGGVRGICSVTLLLVRASSSESCF